MDLMPIAKNCVRDFKASHGGRMPTIDEMHTMLQQSTGIDDISRENAAWYLEIAGANPTPNEEND